MKKLFFFCLMILFIVYSYFVYTTGTDSDTALALSPVAYRGKMIFQKHNCIACHQVYGLGGYLGPELTTVISEKGKGRDYAKAFIHSGTIRMPNFQLTGEETECVVEYLSYVDQTAVTYKDANQALITSK